MRRKLLARRYLLLEEIGSGGMGTVYRARDQRTKTEVAIKVLHPFLRSEKSYIDRFRREGEMARSLKSPYIVRVLDIGHSGDEYFLVMEYVGGESLKILLQRQLRLPTERALRIATEVASALEEAHRKGIIHRDVKPQNILIAKDGTAKVADFGIARPSGGSELTATGDFLGSIQYMAPEALNGRADKCSDIYSLGIVLYEMLMGEPPIKGLTPYELIRGHNDQAPEPIPSLFFGEELQELLTSCLAKSPSNRPQSISQVAAKLEDLLLTAESLNLRPVTNAGGRRRQSRLVTTRLVAAERHLPGELSSDLEVGKNPASPSLSRQFRLIVSGLIIAATAIIGGVVLMVSGNEQGTPTSTQYGTDGTFAAICQAVPPALQIEDCRTELRALNLTGRVEVTVSPAATSTTTPFPFPSPRVSAIAPAATAMPASANSQALQTNRQDCAAIRGTAYLSEVERNWYAANCSSSTVDPLVTIWLPSGRSQFNKGEDVQYCFSVRSSIPVDFAIRELSPNLPGVWSLRRWAPGLQKSFDECGVEPTSDINDPVGLYSFAVLVSPDGRTITGSASVSFELLP